MAEQDLLENPFRDEIYNYLLNHGYVKSLKSDYDVKNALDVTHLFEFLENTQKEELNKFKATYGDNYKQKFITLLNKKIDERGLLRSLKENVEDYASNTKFSLVYFKSNLKEMSESLEKYEKNIFSVRRELAYEDKEKSNRVDLGVFINGIPIVLIELKKQTAGQKAGFEGTKQFRENRNPSELIFSFNKRSLVYFAMDELVAFLTTRLDKKETYFLPFNQGDENEGAGNPVCEGKHSTHYIWEETLQRDMLLRIIREFMFIDDEGKMIFPRYHQLRAVLHCEKDVKENGVGGRYLIWHSAGSGKTKTIAWLAKRLINFNEINTVIVISDRNVIDGQLGTELITVDSKNGVAQHVEDGSAGLKTRINAGGYIIVTTLQKFRPILNEIEQHKDRKYAIIIDEAHSSTAGKSMSKASETLTGTSLKEAVEIDDAYEEIEDGQNQILNASVAIKNTKNVSYFAFTATPKKQTMELFGTRCEKGKTYFDKYSMKQAIEERFILNPLLCYTSYLDSYQITKKKDDDKEYDSHQAQAAILNYISTSDEVINTKVEIMLNDFIERRIDWLNGKAKAIIVTPSRKHAVCYKLAIDKYLKSYGCNFKSCVAFTGTIELEGVKFTETDMNHEWIDSIKDYDIKSIIHNHDDLRIIIVADKLQTGFDESLLSVMYLDKKLGSAVKAVQTISRLNRPEKNKRTFVLDFINRTEVIKEYFTEYYGGELFLPTANETEPNILFTKRDKILDYCVLTLANCDKIYELISNEEKASGELTSIIAKILNNFKPLEEKKQKEFLAELKKFTNLFYYISAVYNSWNAEMEKLAVVFGVVYKVLFEPDVVEKIDPSELVELVDYNTKLIGKDLTIDLETQDQEFAKVPTNILITDKSYSPLDEIIERFNQRYEQAGEELKGIVENLSQDEDLQSNVKNSTKNAYESAVNDKFSDIINDNILQGIMDGNIEKADYYTALSKDDAVKIQICNLIIKNIKSLLAVGN